MASKIDFSALLDKKYPSYTVEVNTFLERCDVSNSIEIATQFIYDKIKDDGKVYSNLKLIYHEALFGTDKGAKLRIKNRVTHFCRMLRPHPKVKQLDMLHAADYANMGLDQINHKLEESKKNDASFAWAMQKQQDMKRKIGKDSLIEQPKGAADDVYWSDEDDCWKFNKGKFEEDDQQKSQDAVQSTAERKPTEKFQEKKFPFGATGFSKKSCLYIGKKPQKSDDDEAVGPCSKEFQEKKKKSSSLFVDLDNSGEQVNADSMKTYGNKSVFGKKKLIPKKEQPNKLPCKPMTKAEKEFDSIMNKDKKTSDKDLSLTSEEEPEQVCDDLKKAFNAKAKKYEAEMDEKEMLSKIHHCTSTVAKASVENTAFLHPLGVEKGLNVGKYRDEVEKELKGGTKKDVQPDPLEDQSEFVPLPDMNDDGNDDNIFGVDPTLWADSPYHYGDDYDLVTYDAPLYQNQMSDPQVEAVYNGWFNKLE